MAVSNKIRGLLEQGSWIRRMFEEGIALKQQFGDDNVFDLSLGNPILEPPEEFFAELRRIADNPSPGMHRYMPNAGYPETRAAVASQLAEETGLNFSADELIMTCGAGGALNVVLKTLLDPGDEVVIFAPYFVEYFFYADNHGGICKVVLPVESFLPDMDALEEAIGERTRAVLINSPNNPTGVLYTEETLATISEVIREKEMEFGTEIFLVSDEPYRKLLFDGLEYPHIFHHHVRSILQQDSRIRQRARPDAAHSGQAAIGNGEHWGIPVKARFHVREPDRDRLRRDKAAGGVLYVPQIAYRG